MGGALVRDGDSLARDKKYLAAQHSIRAEIWSFKICAFGRYH